MIATGPLREFLTTRFGLDVEVKAEKTDDGQCLRIRPAEIEPTIGFRIEVLLGWRSIESTFIPDNYASGLLSAMKEASPDQKAAFVTFASSIVDKGADFDMHFGGVKANPLEPACWPDTWTDFSISMQKVGLLLEQGNDNDSKEAYPWIARFFGTTLALLPLEPISNKEVADEEIAYGEIEGKAYYTTVKKYERSRINRAACIEVHGTRCQVCDINMGEEYGPLAEGFVHVHHVTPASMIGEGYVINPGRDLAPVCPNCHAVIHRTYPPHSMDDVRQALNVNTVVD